MRASLAGSLFAVVTLLMACPPSNGTADAGVEGSDSGSTTSSGSESGNSSSEASGSQGGSSSSGSATSGTSSTGSSSQGGSDVCPAFDSGNASHVAVGRTSTGPAVLQEDTTWTADNTYFVMGTLEVQGSTLTIQAGTHVCLDEGGGSPPSLDIRPADGAGPAGLVVQGTEGNPVVFAPATPASSWNTIVLSPDSAASFDHVVIMGGGAGGAGVLIVPAGFAGPLHATDVVIDGATGMALSLGHEGGLATDASIEITRLLEGATANPVVQASFHSAATLTPANFVVGQDVPESFRWIRLTDNVVSTSVTLPGDLGMPYVLSGDLEVARDSSNDPIPTLTLEAGVELRFEEGELRVGSTSGLDSDGANIVAEGTQANPVRFTSASDAPAAGDWAGIVIYPGSFEPGVTALRHVIISYAGGGFTGGVLYCGFETTPLQAGLRLTYSGGDATYDGPTLEAVEIDSSAGDGLAFTCLQTRCLATDYSAEVSGMDIAGELLRPNTCL